MGAKSMYRGLGSRKACRKLLALGVIVAAALTWSAADRAAAADRKSDGLFISEVSDVRRVTVIVNKSRTFRVERLFATIVAGSPDIADVKSLERSPDLHPGQADRHHQRHPVR